MLYIFHGQNSWAMAEAVRQLEAQVGPPEVRDSNYHRLSASQTSLVEVQGYCWAVPFLAERRLVVLEGLLEMAESRAGRGSEAGKGQSALEAWEGLPEVRWHPVPLREEALVWEDEHWSILGSPVRHSVPTVALRIEDRGDGGVVVYSADTEPCPALVHLARGADILVHEATGEFPGHSSPPAAAEVARAAEVGRLVLVHLPPVVDYEALVEARRRFPATDLGRDGDRLEF